jgi:hypothetical protein
MPPRRLLVAVSGLLVLVGIVLFWHPWQGQDRRQWSTAPAVPASPSPTERNWLAALRGWAAYVGDAREDPTTLAVRDCANRLHALGSAPDRLRLARELAADTCSALTAQARDIVSSRRQIDAKLAGKAAAEGREGERDLALLSRSIGAIGGVGTADVWLARIATRLSGHDATLRCFASERNWQSVQATIGRTEGRVLSLAGFAVIAERHIDLSPGVCRTLHSIRSAGLVAAVHAIEVLTHESEHLAGVDGIENEAKTDCFAAQRMSIAARLLGRPASEARRMGLFYLRVEQPGLPARYRSRECRDGGAYDLRPHDSTFP